MRNGYTSSSVPLLDTNEPALPIIAYLGIYSFPIFNYKDFILCEILKFLAQ